jgi:hypothetical protein
MSKIPSNSHPYREIYNAYQRVIGSNRFIFTQVGITLAITIMLGVLPVMIYFYVWLGFISLALAFEQPYQLLRRLLPYGNWPPHLVGVSVRSKIASIIAIIILILGFMTILWFLHRFILPSSTNLWCDGSLTCILLRRLLS